MRCSIPKRSFPNFLSCEIKFTIKVVMSKKYIVISTWLIVQTTLFYIYHQPPQFWSKHLRACRRFSRA